MDNDKVNWMALDNADAIASPGLLIDPDRVASNVHQMIAMVGGDSQVQRLRPHVKTHKMPDVARIQLDLGIKQFKTATISESAMVASAGANDVLLAYPPVGPNLDRLAELVERFPDTSFATITDNTETAKSIAQRLGDRQRPFRLFIDVDCGMHRTVDAVKQVERVANELVASA